MKAAAPIITSEVVRVDDPSIRYMSFLNACAIVGGELGAAEVVGASVGD